MKKPPPRLIPSDGRPSLQPQREHPASERSSPVRLVPNQPADPEALSLPKLDARQATPRLVEQRGPHRGRTASVTAAVPARGALDGALDGAPDNLEEPGEAYEQWRGESYDAWRRARRMQRQRVLGLVVLIVSAVLVIGGVIALVLYEQRRDVPDAGRDPLSRFVDTTPPPSAALARGSYVSARILDDGRVEVSQWVRTVRPIDGLELEMPDPPPGVVTRRVSGVLVAPDHTRAIGPTTVGKTARRYDFNAPVTLVQIRYTLDGSVERSPSRRGRALVTAAFLTTSIDAKIGPMRVDLGGAEVLSAACWGPGAPAPRPCGGPRPGAKGWRVMLHGASRGDLVQAQVNLD